MATSTLYYTQNSLERVFLLLLLLPPLLSPFFRFLEKTDTNCNTRYLLQLTIDTYICVSVQSSAPYLHQARLLFTEVHEPRTLLLGEFFLHGTFHVLFKTYASRRVDDGQRSLSGATQDQEESRYRKVNVF